MNETESVTERNRSIMGRFYAAAQQGDPETMMDCLADDVIVYEPAYLPYGGKYHGKDALPIVFGALAQLADVSQFKIHHVLVDGDRAVGVGGFPVSDTGGFTHFAEESRLVDGKIAEVRLYYYDAQSLLSAGKVGAGG